MATRHRAVGAVIFGDHILMVRHVHNGRDYWTLPGEGVEPGETKAQAAEREVFEETGVQVQVEQFVFDAASRSGRNHTHCFLMTRPQSMAFSVGVDPEESDQPLEERMLLDVSWQPLESVKDDFMVKEVIALLYRRQG